MRTFAVTLCLLFVTGCAIDDGIWIQGGHRDASFLDLSGVFDLSGLVDPHPMRLRALLTMHCDSAEICSNGKPVAKHCGLRDSAAEDRYAAEFTRCMLACGELDACYRNAVDVAVPSVHLTAYAECGTRVIECQVDSDGCDALLVLTSSQVASAIEVCKTGDCADLQGCLKRAVFTPLAEDDADAGT